MSGTKDPLTYYDVYFRFCSNEPTDYLLLTSFFILLLEK